MLHLCSALAFKERVLEIQAMSHQVLKTNRSFCENFKHAVACGSFLSLQGTMISKAMLLSCLVASNSHLYVNNKLNSLVLLGECGCYYSCFLGGGTGKPLIPILLQDILSLLQCWGELLTTSSPVSCSLQHSLHHTPSAFL